MLCWTFERRANGDDVLIEREVEMNEVDGDEEAARRAARRTKCLWEWLALPPKASKMVGLVGHQHRKLTCLRIICVRTGWEGSLK